MRKSIINFLFVVLAILLLIPSLVFAEEPPEITAPSGVLIDAATGDVLYDKNAHVKMYPASTTKIMTAILVLENANLDDIVVIDEETPFTDGSRIYVMEDEELTVEQLLYALMVESANDAAVALAKHVSGTVEDFAQLMNERAKELGALNTNFVNPNGLPDEEHVTTAYDLAMIARYGMTLPMFDELVNTIRYQIPPTNKQEETRYFKNSNRFLWGVGGANKILYKGKWMDIKYDKIDGVKTGYTTEAKQCLVSSASKEDHRFISVALKAEGLNIYMDSRTLIDYGLNNFKFLKIVKENQIVSTATINDGIETELTLGAEKDFYKAIPIESELREIQSEIMIPEEINAPVEENDIIGKVMYTSDGKPLAEVNLIAMKTIPARQSLTTVFFMGKSPSSKAVIIVGTLFILFIIWRTIITIIRLNRKNRIMLNRRKKEREVIRQITFSKMSELYKKK